MADTPRPEVWLRGPVAGVPPLLQPVAHALLQAREEVVQIVEGFPDDRLWSRPAGAASVGFHLQHLSGVLDRLLTYARGEELDEAQLAALRAEGDPPHPGVSAAALAGAFERAVDRALEQLRATPEGTLTEARGVGRAGLPSTVLGLLFHAAEHTQRHLGQLLVTARVVHPALVAGGRRPAPRPSAPPRHPAPITPVKLQPPRYPLVDLDLSRRLERAEADASASFADARARLRPASGAAWIEVGGAYAVYDGVGSPLTQTFGLGLFSEPSDADLDALEAFYRERDAEVFHEVSPLGSPSLLARLGERGYRPVELTSVLFRPTAPDPAAPDLPGTPVRVRRVAPEEAEHWARVAAEGWSTESAELGEFMLEIGEITARKRDSYCFFAELEGEPVAAGALSIAQGVALLAGASTVPAGRRRGAQQALLAERLRFAAERGCPLAMMGALPGSGSQRNAERRGFRIAYTRIKWQLHAP